jgi:hypothetical protein
MHCSSPGYLVRSPHSSNAYFGLVLPFGARSPPQAATLSPNKRSKAPRSTIAKS